MSRLGEALTDPALEPPVAAMIVWNSNPLVIVPNAELTRRGLARDDLFTVVHEQFLTDTARYADIVLPATTQLESTDVVPAWGHLWMGWNEAAIEPLGESCSNTELFRRLAAAMGLTEPALFDDDESLLAQALGAKVDLAELRRVGWLRVPYPDDGRPWAAGVFPTPSGKVELVSERLAAMGQPALPTFVAPREGPHGDADLVARYPLQLLTPEAPHPVPELELLRAAEARPRRGRPVRRARRRPTPPPADSPTATGPACGTTGPASSCRYASAIGCGPAWSRSRSVGGAPSTPTGGRPTRSPTTPSPSGAVASPTATPWSRWRRLA